LRAPPLRRIRPRTLFMNLFLALLAANVCVLGTIFVLAILRFFE
jgi:hypothetical protein